jgi:hypothetical protein
VLHWLCWSLGFGHSILLGKDMIMGLGKASIFTQERVASVNQRNIHYLYQASKVLRPGMICSTWLESDELDLDGDQAIEWNSFRRSLIGFGVQLTDRPDELKWTGGDNSSILTIKNIYSAIATKL